MPLVWRSSGSASDRSNSASLPCENMFCSIAASVSRLLTTLDCYLSHSISRADTWAGIPAATGYRKPCGARPGLSSNPLPTTTFHLNVGRVRKPAISFGLRILPLNHNELLQYHLRCDERRLHQLRLGRHFGEIMHLPVTRSGGLCRLATPRTQHRLGGIATSKRNFSWIGAFPTCTRDRGEFPRLSTATQWTARHDPQEFKN